MSYAKEHAGTVPGGDDAAAVNALRSAVMRLSPPTQAPAGRRVAEPHRDVGARHPRPVRPRHARRAGPQGACAAAVDDAHRGHAGGQGTGPAGAAPR